MIYVRVFDPNKFLISGQMKLCRNMMPHFSMFRFSTISNTNMTIMTYRWY